MYDNRSVYEIPGFCFLKTTQNKGKGGGIVMYIPNVLWNRREDHEIANIECYLPRNWKVAFSDVPTKICNSDKEAIL